MLYVVTIDGSCGVFETAAKAGLWAVREAHAGCVATVYTVGDRLDASYLGHLASAEYERPLTAREMDWLDDRRLTTIEAHA